MSGSITTFGELSVRPAPPTGASQQDTRVLGAAPERPFELGGPKPRLLLALLVARANSAFRVGDLIDALWGERPPRTARKNLQVYVSRLRRAFGPALVHTQGGYLLRLAPEDCDLVRFEELARHGRRLARDGDPGAAEALRRAVGLWRCRPLAEFDTAPEVAAAVDRLERLFLDVLEDWAELALDCGESAVVLERLQDVARPQVPRERLAAVWMRALASVGRANEALAYYEEVRRALAGELGVPPGPVLTALHARLLRPPGPGRPRPERPGNQLPRDLPDFVGRAEQVERVVAELAEPASGAGGVLVVSGPVGVGKTAFAAHTAHLLASAFPDGLLMVELGGRPQDAVLGELLDAAGAPRGGSPAQELARWRSWVARRRLLVVLDDAVWGRSAQALLPGAGPSAALVTSRYRLGGMPAAVHVDLPPLCPEEGVELLGRVVGHGRVVSDPAAAHRIVDLCEGLPLALRATGARLNTLRHVPLADYARRLRAAPCLLDEMAVGELVLRERYEAFWRDLPEPQRAAYRSVAAHTHAPAAPARPTPADAPESLLECHLLTPPNAEVSAHLVAYRMSRFAYEFGRERAAGDGARRTDAREAAAP
ncbi:BTAD domain-containing putative transcriptional regulator [Streptomyces sp. NPDC050560]|uniref:AfsR/SARP family transcriptional regulator n=1 Tax=Streptomyces sp. NPDC050560 TaxID=3365630 RepID=UPI003791CA6B